MNYMKASLERAVETFILNKEPTPEKNWQNTGSTFDTTPSPEQANNGVKIEHS